MDRPIFNDFEDAGNAVLAFLHQRLNFDLWMITRKKGENWIVLQSKGDGFDLKSGTTLRWADSLCSEMASGKGPNIVPNLEKVPAFSSTRTGHELSAKAYIGFPLFDKNNELFGTLCAFDSSIQPESIVEEQPLIELLVSMLNTLLQAELQATEQVRQTERLEQEALTDPLTNLYNRRGWNQLCVKEDERCRRFGYSAAILICDLDDLKTINDTEGHATGDALLLSTASALRKAVRTLDIVARLGGDEFGILAIECERAGADALHERIDTLLGEAGIRASIGLALGGPEQGLKLTWQQADLDMYKNKKNRTHHS
ncbi:MAG: diguanylate cyclase [Gammaproteobacteria bacterium]